MTEHLEIWPMTKEEREAARKSDAYGFKKMLSDVIKHYTCPKCKTRIGIVTLNPLNANHEVEKK